MQLDKKTLDRLLNLSDEQIRVLLRRLLAEYGVNPAAVPLEQMNIGKLREALRGTTGTDIARFLQLVQAAGLGKGGDRA